MVRLEFNGRTIYIAGGKSSKKKDALLKAASMLMTEKKTSMQIIDAEKIFGIDHIRSAFEKAVRSIEQEENVSDSLATETVLYISGCRQIQEALSLIGLKNDSESIIVLFETDSPEIFSRLAFKESESVLATDHKDPRSLGITDIEIGTVQEKKKRDLVLERVAAVDVKKK